MLLWSKVFRRKLRPGSRIFGAAFVLLVFTAVAAGCGSGFSAYYPVFETPPGDIALTFSVASDTRSYAGDNLAYFRSACETLAGGGPGAFMLSAGDTDPPELVLYTIRTYIGESYGWYPAVGNHETETASDMLWLRSYNAGGSSLPGVVNPGPPGSMETTYSFDRENVHFIVLNEYYDGVKDTATDGDISDALYNWLVDDLENYSKPVTFVIGHEPAYPLPDEQNGRVRHSGDSLDKYAERRDRFWSALALYGVKAFITGHTHNYSTAKLGGVWQIDSAHARGRGDEGARSTFIMFYVMANGDVWYYAYRMNLSNGVYELVEYELLN